MQGHLTITEQDRARKEGAMQAGAAYLLREHQDVIQAALTQYKTNDQVVQEARAALRDWYWRDR